MVAWTSSAPAVATVNSAGLATAVSVGSATITATMAGATPSTATITVTPSTTTAGGDVTSVSVIPSTRSVPVNDTTQFIATGTTSSGATVNVPTRSSGVPVAPRLRQSPRPGLQPRWFRHCYHYRPLYECRQNGSHRNSKPHGYNRGECFGDVTSISVIPGTQSVPSNDTAQFIANNNLIGNDGEPDRLGLMSSSSAQVATITASGLATAAVPGTATITALFTNADKTVTTGISSLTVTASAGGSNSGDVTSISVIPGTQSDALGDQTQFIAIGTALSGATETWETRSPGLQATT